MMLQRIAIWKRYYDTIQLKAPGSYAILEHFADNNEEKELADYGMLLWGNLNHCIQQAAMGHSTDWDFSRRHSYCSGLDESAFGNLSWKVMMKKG